MGYFTTAFYIMIHLLFAPNIGGDLLIVQSYKVDGNKITNISAFPIIKKLLLHDNKALITPKSENGLKRITLPTNHIAKSNNKHNIEKLNKIFHNQILEGKHKANLIFILCLIIITMMVLFYFHEKRKKIMIKKLIINERIKEAEYQKEIFAKELHDGIGSNLTGIRLQLLALHDTVKNVDGIHTIINEVEKTHQSVRLLSHQTASPDFDNCDLDTAINKLVQINSVKNTKVNYTNSTVFKKNKVESVFQLNLYRIVQEALNNIAKHAMAKNVEISILQHKNNLNVIIEDDGVGFMPTNIERGFGLRSITDRVKSLKGILKIDSFPAKGTSIIIDLPIN